MTIICSGAIQNAGIIYVIVRDRRLHRTPYYFVINYVIADLLRAVTCLPFVHASLLHGARWRYGSSACKLLTFTNMFLVSGSLIALLVLASERFTATLYRKLHARLRGGVCLSAALLGWTTAFLLAFTPVYGFHSYAYSEPECTTEYGVQTSSISAVFAVGFLFVMTLSVLLYAASFVYVRRHRRAKSPEQQPTTPGDWNCYLVPSGITSQTLNRVRNESGSPDPQLSYLIQQQHRQQQQQQQQQPLPPLPPPLPQPLQSYCIALRVFHAQSTDPEVNELHLDNGRTTFLPRCACASLANNQLTRALFIVTSCYDVLWLPFVIMTCCYAFRVDNVVLEKCISVSTWFTYLQVAVIPLVYILSHRPVRKHAPGRHNAECDATAELPAYLQDVNI